MSCGSLRREPSSSPVLPRCANSQLVNISPTLGVSDLELQVSISVSHLRELLQDHYSPLPLQCYPAVSDGVDEKKVIHRSVAKVHRLLDARRRGSLPVRPQSRVYRAAVLRPLRQTPAGGDRTAGPPAGPPLLAHPVISRSTSASRSTGSSPI